MQSFQKRGNITSGTSHDVFPTFGVRRRWRLRNTSVSAHHSADFSSGGRVLIVSPFSYSVSTSVRIRGGLEASSPPSTARSRPTTSPARVLAPHNHLVDRPETQLEVSMKSVRHNAARLSPKDLVVVGGNSFFNSRPFTSRLLSNGAGLQHHAAHRKWRETMDR